MPPNGWWGGPWWIFPIIMPLMMIVGIVFFLFALRAVFGIGPLWTGRPGHAEDKDVALQILRERYARGEITEEEFLDRKAMLEVKQRNRFGR